MFDFTTLPPHVITARGQYSTVRAAHEDELKLLAQKASLAAATAAQILRAMQPEEGVPADPFELLKTARKALDDIEACAIRVRGLAEQKQELKPLAWGKQ
jgi:hypothetical protein